MKNNLLTFTLVLLAMTFFIAGQIHAGPILGTNITIFDKILSNVAPIPEDNECEPGALQSQAWDLEGVFLKGNLLTLVGGWNFAAGEVVDSHHYISGNLFIDTNGVLQYGYPPGSTSTSNSVYGYEYAIKMNFSNNTYKVYALDGNSTFNLVSGGPNPQATGSNPFTLNPVSEPVVANGSLVQAPLTAAEKADTGVLDWNGNNTHYKLTGFDLSFLPQKTTFITHFTQTCGNDSLMGQGTTVPVPGSLLLMASGLIGLLGLVRRSDN